MPATYTPIASSAITTDTTQVVFSGIPQTYTDIVVVCTGTNNYSQPFLRFNGITSYQYNRLILVAAYSGLYSFVDDGYSGIFIGGGYAGWSAIYNNTSVAHIFDYTNTNTMKNVLSVDTNPETPEISIMAGVWSGTSAITSITVRSAGMFNAGTNISLYGIKAA